MSTAGPEEIPDRADGLEIQGENGVTLRQLRLQDAQAYFDLIEYDRAHLSQNHNGNRDRTANKYKTVEDVLQSILHPDNPGKMRFGIWINGVMVGSNNLTPSETDPKAVESGSWIGKQYTGRHYAAQAREVLVEMALNRLGFEEVFSDIAVGNDASRKSVEKSGFIYQGIIEDKDEDGSIKRYWRYSLRKNT